MAIRWYSTVIDCHDVTAQGRWWAETLGWQVIHESAEEVIIIPAHVGPETVRTTPWEQLGPGLVFVPVAEDKAVKNRLHLDLAPHTSDDRDGEIARLLDRGARLATSVSPLTPASRCSRTRRATSSACCRHATCDARILHLRE